MSQSRIQSFTEACVGTAIGFAVAIIAQVFASWWFCLHTSLATDLKITVFFTIISIARSYAVRRAFNRRGRA